jgi:iron complex outermembrane receptor protein
VTKGKWMANALRKILALTSSALCLGVAAPAAAQAQTQASASGDANEIIVTARRQEERLQDVPISITVFNQEQIDARNIVNPSDLATYTPSLAANRQYGTEKASFSIRGFVQELGTQPSVAVYFADVVAPRAQGPTTSGNGTMPGTMFDLANLQVLRGPQGTLFGRNTTGGAVLMVPRRPTDEFEGYAEASFGDYDMMRFQGVMNAPLSENARLRVGFDTMTRDGYLNNRSGIGPDDFANVNYASLRGSLVLDLTDDIENYTVATLNDSNTHGHLPRLIECARDLDTRSIVQIFAQPGCGQLDRQNARGDGYYDVENDVPDPQVHLRQMQFINTTTWDVSETLRIRNIISYADFREATKLNIDGGRFLVPEILEVRAPPPLPPVLFLPMGDREGMPFHLAVVEPGPSGDQAAQSTFTEELQFQGRTSDDRFNWQAGLYYESSEPIHAGTQFSSLLGYCTDAASFQCSDPLGPFLSLSGTLGSLGLIDQQFEFRNSAVYAQGTYALTQQLSLTVGARYTNDRIEATAQNAAIRFPGGVPTITCSKNGETLASLNDRAICAETVVSESSRPTWLVDLDYTPSDNVLLYAKYARGYRQGSINLLPLTPDLNAVEPEQVDSFEVGAKTSFDGVISGVFNIAAFYNDFSDQQLQANTLVRDPSIFPVNVLVNAGSSKIQGVEIETSLNLFEGFRLDIAYAYLDTELESISLPDLSTNPYYSGLAPTAAVGGPLVYSPENRVTITGTYTLPLPENIGRVSLGATFTHTDEQYSSHADDGFVGQLGYNPGLLPATDLVNLNLDWESVGGHPIDLSVFATNVTDEQHYFAIFGAYQLGYESILIAEPRMVGARLRARFGQ